MEKLRDLCENREVTICEKRFYGVESLSCSNILYNTLEMGTCLLEPFLVLCRNIVRFSSEISPVFNVYISRRCMAVSMAISNKSASFYRSEPSE